MHDANGTPLKKGDIVIIEAEVVDLQPGEDYCNVSLATVHGRRPDGSKEHINAINTGVMVKLRNAAVASMLLIVLILTGCQTALTRYEASMAFYTAANNAAADLFDAGKVDREQLAAFRDAGQVARRALNAWATTISSDGRTDDGAARAAADAALAAMREWLATIRGRQ